MDATQLIFVRWGLYVVIIVGLFLGVASWKRLHAKIIKEIISIDKDIVYELSIQIGPVCAYSSWASTVLDRRVWKRWDKLPHTPTLDRNYRRLKEFHIVSSVFLLAAIVVILIL